MDVRDVIPDARDGLTRLDRAILAEVHALRRELNRDSVPTITVWGRLVERGFRLSQDELSARLGQLGALLEPASD